MRIALTLAVLLALGTSARAGNEVGVIVTGDGSMQPQLAAQLADWLSHHGHTLVPSPLPADAISAMIDCFVIEDQGCARGIVEKRAKATRVVFAHVDTKDGASNGARDVTLTAYWFDKGHDAVAARKTCARCTDQSLRTTADDLMKKLIGASGAPGHVKLKSAPPGARILVDGQAIGVAPLDWDLPPGKHTIQMDKAGHEPVSREIVVASDRTDLVVLTLPTAGDQARRPSRLVPYSLIGTGAALLVTGGVLIALGDDRSNDRYTYRDYRPPGYGLAIGGAVAGGVGAYLLLRTPKRTSAPVASVTRDTAYVGWVGRF